MALKHRLFKLFHPFFKPRMIWGYRNAQGKLLKNVRISTHTFIDREKHLVLEDHVYIGHFNFIEASHDIHIGEGTQLTNFITLTTHSSHQSIRLYGRQYTSNQDHKGYVSGEIRIGRYCFIGPNCVIMPNTQIGKGSLVAAYSYLQGEFPEFSIIKGNPAKVVGSTREMDDRLLKQHPELSTYYNEWQ